MTPYSAMPGAPVASPPTAPALSLCDAASRYREACAAYKEATLAYDETRAALLAAHARWAAGPGLAASGDALRVERAARAAAEATWLLAWQAKTDAIEALHAAALAPPEPHPVLDAADRYRAATEALRVLRVATDAARAAWHGSAVLYEAYEAAQVVYEAYEAAQVVELAAQREVLVLRTLLCATALEAT